LTATNPAAAARGVAKAARSVDWTLAAAIVAVFLVSRAIWLVIAYAQGHGVFDITCRWDCAYYIDIADNGYALQPSNSRGEANWAFFPLYPAIVAAVGWLTGLTAVQAGTLTSSLLILLGTYVGAIYLRETRPGARVTPFVVLTLAGAGAFYLNAVYTEPRFYALACCALLSWVRGRDLTTGIIGALLSATRAVGVFFVVAIFVDLLCRHRGRILGAIHRRPTLAITLALCPAGLFVFMALLHATMGDGFAFSHVQIGWGRSFADPVGRIASAFTDPDLGNVLGSKERSLTYNAIWALVGIGLVGWSFWRRRIVEAVFGALCLAVPLAAGLDSFSRFVVGCPVLAFAATDLLNRLKPAWLAWLAIAASAALNLWLLSEWMNSVEFLT
jgi:hypothetical protein